MEVHARRGACFRKLLTKATLAQLVERLIRNQQVASSILAGGSILRNACLVAFGEIAPETVSALRISIFRLSLWDPELAVDSALTTWSEFAPLYRFQGQHDENRRKKDVDRDMHPRYRAYE